MNCPLCQNSKDFIPITGADHRAYFKCLNCYLIFTHQYLTRNEEEARYRTHQNGPQYEGHVKFLYRAITPALPYLNTTQRGLDYGCGPVPTLSVILKDKHGIACDDYDPIFYPEPPLGNYDFIFSTECFEHFFSPAKEVVQLHQLLNDNGLLIIMTDCWDETINLKTWYYFRDPTHVSYYHRKTMHYIAHHFNFDFLPIPDDRVFILKKNIYSSYPKSNL